MRGRCLDSGDYWPSQLVCWEAYLDSETRALLGMPGAAYEKGYRAGDLVRYERLVRILEQVLRLREHLLAA
jgi:hypothetical protein